MARGRSLVTMLVVLVMSVVPSTATRAWARQGSHGHPGQSPGEQAQMRELLAKLAAASGTPEPEEKTDADLMYDAMLRWNGPTPGSAAVDRLIDSSKKEAAKSKRATQDKVRRMFWKDPFADDPGRLVLVRQEDRDLLDTYQRKSKRSEAREESRPSLNLNSEVARLRRELAQARADAEEARAEAERVKERADMKRSCVADGSDSGEVRKRRHAGSSYRSNHPDRTPPQQIALATTAPQVSLPPPQPVAAPPAPIPAHGIIIEPLPSPPTSPPVVEARRRSSRLR